MSTIKHSTKRIGTVVLGLSFYALLTVQCASQTSDSVSVPRAAWEKLESSIQGVAEAMRTIYVSTKTNPYAKNSTYLAAAFNRTECDGARSGPACHHISGIRGLGAASMLNRSPSAGEVGLKMVPKEMG